MFFDDALRQELVYYAAEQETQRDAGKDVQSVMPKVAQEVFEKHFHAGSDCFFDPGY